MKTLLAAILFALSIGCAQAATCDVREYDQVRKVNDNSPPIAKEPALSHNYVAVGGTHAESTPFSNATQYVRTFCSVQACFEEGASPVATTGSSPLPIGGSEYFSVQPGHSISVIACTP